MIEKVDLHIHTVASDGLFTPVQAVQSAVYGGVGIIAIADHDTVDGVEQAMDEARRQGVEVLPAIELSAEYETEVHILGYGIDIWNLVLKKRLDELKDYRDERNPYMVEKLQKLGIDITLEQVKEKSEGSTGRPHIARVLVEKGYAKDIADAFEKYLGKGKAAYAEKKRLSIKECIELVQNAGGVAVLAHPLCMGLPDWRLEPLLKQMMHYGLKGLEVFHPSQKGMERQYLEMAKRLGLIVTAGSDDHEGVMLCGYEIASCHELKMGIFYLQEKWKSNR